MVAENDPYNDLMNSEKNDIRPGFLGGNGDGDKAAGALAAAENIASAALVAKGGGAAAAGKAGDAAASGGAKKAMSDGMKDGAQDGVKKADAAEKNPGGFYNKNNSGDDEPNLKMSKGAKRGLMAGLAVAAPFLIILLVIGGILALLIGLPVLMIGGIDYNLMKVLGFEETIGILEEQGEHVTAEFAKNGQMPKDYFQDLVANGIDVGQITANGDFVRTDTYIANIENRDDLVAAASGFSYISEEEGELAMLWDGEVIRADDFVAAVESDPNLYAAYSKAADIDTKYYYSEGVDEVYRDMGLSRGNFNDFEVSGNYEEDDEKFLDILNKTLENGSNIVVGGALDNQKANSEGTTMIEEDGDTPCDDSSDGGTYCREVSEMDASSASSQVAENTKEYIIRWEWVKNETGLWFWQPVYSSNSTRRAAELLNTAVSSNEPYLASNAFVAVEEAIQRARVEGGGPVNHVMNALTRGKEASYQNVETGAIETSNLSILETRNFRAAVSDSKYSKEEAQNFGRDRVLKTTGQADSDIIKKTTVGTSGKSSANSVVRNGKGGEADSGTVARANENLELSDSKNNPEAFQSVIGGNRIIEGGSMLSNTINMHRIGAMPSDAGTIAAYHQEVEKTMARRVEAERASKNPFDISSPYTFLGSIVHNFATTLLGSYGSNMTGISALSSAGNVAGKAVANLANTATAQGGDDEFTTMSGLGCETVGSAGGIEGDLYCTSHNTVSTKYMSNTQGDWDGAIDEGAYKDFTLLAMDRYSSVGTKDAGVCEKYKELHGGIISKIGNFFKQMFGIYEACKIEVDENDQITDPEQIEKLKIYTGGAYSFGSEKTEDLELMSGYALYTEVKSLLSGEESATAAIRREYYAKHPKDNSEAAAIARRSGMTKSEAEIALAYSDYLNMIANYDPSGRQMVTTPVISFEKPILEYHSDEVALNLYAWYSKQTEYDDLRTRNFVV